MRESQPLLSQQNLQHKNTNAKGKERVNGGTREEGDEKTNGLNRNGLKASAGPNGTKAKEGRRGSIRKKWNAYRKKAE